MTGDNFFLSRSSRVYDYSPEDNSPEDFSPATQIINQPDYSLEEISPENYSPVNGLP